MELTPAQETMAAAIEDQWLATALSTAPADRAAAEEGVRSAYRLAGLAPPEHIFWTGSPRAGTVAAALLSGAPPETGAPQWVRDVHDGLSADGWRPGERSGRSVRREVRTAPWAAARAAAVEALGPGGWAQLGAASGRRAWPLVMDRVAGRLRLRLTADLSEEPSSSSPGAAPAAPAAPSLPGAAPAAPSLPGAAPAAPSLPGGAASGSGVAGSGLGRAGRLAVLDAIYGQHDAAWLATFDAADRLCPGTGLMAPLAGLAAVAGNAGWWWAGERFAVLTERPVRLARDNVGRLHRGDGAALEFPDGYGLWAWRGMPIPAELATELPRLTLGRIRRESNAEIRRVMLEHFGYDRYLREAGARSLGTDPTGTLWYLDLPGDEPLVMVEVVNSTPEPDGTSRVYWLRVPPHIRTARDGVAWTFGLTGKEYQPLVQT